MPSECPPDEHVTRDTETICRECHELCAKANAWIAGREEEREHLEHGRAFAARMWGERPWWNVEAKITVRLALRRETERYGDDADGRRGETRECIEVERQEVTGDNETLRGFVDFMLNETAASRDWDAIARDAGL